MTTPLVLIPGLLCDERLWREQIAQFDATHPVTVADVMQDDSIAAMAARTLAVAPPRFALAGLSMGGYVAQEIMRQAPERVERLALLDTSARPESEESAVNRRALIKLAEIGKFKGVTPRLLPRLIHPDRMADAVLTQTVMAMAEAVGQAAFLRQQTAILGRIDSRPGLAAITVPTLVLCGRDDRVTPPALAQEMAADIATSHLVIVDHCGHLSTLEQPDAVNAAFERWFQWE